MRKKIVIGGAIVLFVGALLFISAFFFPPRQSVVDTTVNIPAGYYQWFAVSVPFGASVYSEHTASDEVEFTILDSHNYGLLDAEKDWDKVEETICYFYGKLQAYTFHAPKDDTYYFVLNNFGDNEVNALVKLQGEVSWARFVCFGGVGLSVIGFVSLIVGLILRAKIVEVPLKLLDAMKLHRRKKVSELATQFKTTEADIELAVIKLKSRGEPIHFDRETREVIYTSSK